MSDHPIADLRELLGNLEPVLHPDAVIFAVLPAGTDPAAVPFIAIFRETEGTTVVLREADAAALRLQPLFHAAWITLSVYSDLEAVGLTAAVSTALADAGISCNVIAAAYHDHLFVPADAGERAMHVLETVRSEAAARNRERR